ncbi:MAG: SDR family oxidoreductase [Acidobacteriia bacterium]|nr:SDR family oxidoreductase [Terriglobia bacterium]
MDLGLKDRVVIVAASSQGIGRATAEAFAAEGCKLAICARSTQTLRLLAATIAGKHHVPVHCEGLDVGDAAAVRQFVGNVANRFGGVDVCVTNAGGPPAKGFLATTAEDWQQAVEQNLLSVVHFARAVVPLMQRKKWGRLITITSLTVKQPVDQLVLSNAVRSGVVGLVKSLANEFGPDGITVNNVGPGYTATGRLKELARAQAQAAEVAEEEIFARWAAASPLRRIARPEEVADAIVWLASERASFITGQTLLVDGGAYKGL